MISASRTAVEAAMSGCMNIPPNYFLWLAKGKVTAEEAAALFVNIDPASLVLARLSSNKRDDYQRFLNFAVGLQVRPLLDWFKSMEGKLLYPSHVQDILNAFGASTCAKQEKLGKREESTYLNIIGALLGLILPETHGERKVLAYGNETAITNTLLEKYKGVPGISKRTLEDKFAAAKRSLLAN